MSEDKPSYRTRLEIVRRLEALDERLAELQQELGALTAERRRLRHHLDAVKRRDQANGGVRG